MAIKPRSPAADVITFERKPAPIAVFFLVVPALILVLIAFTVANYRFPLGLLALLSAVGATCLFWIKTAIDQVGPVVLELGPSELHVKRLIGGSTYAWNDIEAIKLFDPGPSLSDSGRSESKRIGIGLHLRVKNQKKAADAPPDAVIITATQEGADAVMAACERLIAVHRKGGNVARSASGSGGQFGRQGRGFRRPNKTAAA